jgi:hypothetical protein
MGGGEDFVSSRENSIHKPFKLSHLLYHDRAYNIN